MDIVAQLRPYIDGTVSMKGNNFTLESVEEDHLVLRDEDSMHTMVWYSSIQSIKEKETSPPEIILRSVKSSELD